jgi:hypothetical protein
MLSRDLSVKSKIIIVRVYGMLFTNKDDRVFCLFLENDRCPDKSLVAAVEYSSMCIINLSVNT